MKKILFSILTSVVITSFANDIPTGIYGGYLYTPSGAKVSGAGDSNITTNNLITVHIDKMPDFGNQTGLLTANVTLNSSDCFGGVGKLLLAPSGMPINVTSPSCKFDSTTNTITGIYKTTPPIVLQGSYSFSKQ